MCGVRLQLRHTTAARRLLKNAAEAQDRYPPQNELIERTTLSESLPTTVVSLYPQHPEFFRRHAQYLLPTREPCCRQTS